MSVSTSHGCPPRRQRVRALAPDDRRAALIEATIPLLREHGLAVSTRQIADAAGVAEGTIFGVFPDKSSLIRAAVIAAFDPEPVVRQLGEIEQIRHPDWRWRRANLRRRLEAVVGVLGTRIAQNGAIMAAVRRAAISPGEAAGHAGEAAGHAGETVGHAGEVVGPPAEILTAQQRIRDAIAAVIEPDRDLLRQTPATTAQLLLGLVFATSRGVFGGAETLDTAGVVSLLLDGLLVGPQSRPDPGESSC